MARNKIKGITIEIGGNTTQLDKALQGVNGKLKTTQSNLKEVERHLKLDPGNTELLAQKQRLLGEAAASSAEKFKTLGDAVKDADQQLARGNAFREKYAPLIQSLDEAIAAYDKMKEKKEDMDKQLELGEISTEAYDKWAAKLKEAQDTLKGLRKQVADAKAEMGGPMIDQAQFDALQRAYVDAEHSAKEADKAFKNFNGTAEQVAAVAGKIADGAGKVADATKGISAAAGVASGGLIGLAVNAGKTADDLNTLSKQSGFSTETLQEWTYAADLIDVSVDDIIGAARKMKKNMGSETAETQEAFDKLGVSVAQTSIQMKDAEAMFYQVVDSLIRVGDETERNELSMTLLGESVDGLVRVFENGPVSVLASDAVSAVNTLRENVVGGSEDVQTALRSIGVSTNDVSVQVRDSEEVFYQLLDALSNIPNETERDILAMQIFGKSADDLAGIIDDGGAALRQLGEEAHAAGLILSQDALDKANEFNDGLDQLKAKAQAAFLEAGAELADTLLPALDNIVEAVSGLLQWIAGLDGDKLQLLLSVLLAVSAIAPVASAISAIAGAVASVSTGVGMLTAALGSFNITSVMTTMTFGQWALIIMGVVAAVLLLVAAFSALTGKAKDIKMPDIPSVPGINGGTGGSNRPSGRSAYNLSTATAEDLPHLAQGAVTRPNSPFLAVVGDNSQEPEVISPLSTIRQAVRDVVGDGGQGSNIRVTVNFTGTLAQVVRLMQPEIAVEIARLGPQLVK